MTSKFEVIVADPPWAFDDGLKKMKKNVKRSAASQYSTLNYRDIEALQVDRLTDPAGTVLALWVPSTLLEQGFKVMHAWGFQLKQTLVWVKTKKPKRDKDGNIINVDPNDALAFGMGRLFRQCHEFALIGTSGKSVYPLLEDHSQRSVILAPNEGHSIKPEALQDRLELMFPNANKCEMFARRNRPGWTCLGDAIDGKDIRQAIQELIVP